jgi:hypothetical protein
MLHKHVRGLHSSSAASSAPAPGATAAADGTFAAGAAERPVFVKVGDGHYFRFRKPWNEVHKMEVDLLLKALKADDLFGVKFTGVDLSACSVAVVKNEKLGGAKVPRAGQDEGDNVVELEGPDTVGSVAAAAGSDAAGAPLFIRVRTPPPHLEAGELQRTRHARSPV